MAPPNVRVGLHQNEHLLLDHFKYIKAKKDYKHSVNSKETYR